MRQELVICRRGGIPHKKYHPRKLEPMWVVLLVKNEWVTVEGTAVEQTTTKTVYGPATLIQCNAYIVGERGRLKKEGSRSVGGTCQREANRDSSVQLQL